MAITKKQADQYIEDVFNGKIDVKNLPEDIYLAIADRLTAGLYQGFGGTLSDFSGRDYELLAELRENIYMFSGAKTYQEVREMTDLLVDKDGGLRSFDDFKTEALKVHELYNETYLETEYNTAVGQGASAVAWQQIESQKSILPFLKYNAILDERTDEICASLDGLVAPVDDPIWSDYSPLNHFNCRCVLDQLEEDSGDGPDYDDTKEKVSELVDDVFKNNPGKTGYVFNEDHPYFTVLKEDKAAAQNNFNLPIPKPEKAKGSDDE